MNKSLLLIALAFGAFSLHAQNYTNAESVEYDPVNDQWLVSNGSRMIADDGDGDLTFFGTGPAQLGCEVLGNTVFASIGDGVNGYDLNSESIVMSINIPGTSFLNGMTNDGVSTLYTTGFSTNTIWAIDVSDLDNPVATQIVANTEQTPNGILYDGANNRLLYATWTNPARIKAVNLADNTVSDIITTNVGQIDGIDDDADGNYYVSSWSPDRITKYNSDFSSSEIVVTPSINSPADIGVSQSTNVLAIPVFNDVVFVDLTILSNDDFLSEDYGFGVSSNPVNQSTFAQFTANTSEDVTLSLYDVQGKLIKSMLEEPNASGTYKVLFAGLQLESGLYFLELKTASGYSKTIQLISE